MHECAAMLGVDYEHCQVQNMLVGGGFGGKEDMSVQHHAALMAYVARVPVKVKLSRQESILVHPKRHSMDMEFTMGCDENGIIQGVKARVVSDTGAFASLGGPVLERACTHAAGPYAYENFEIEGWAYYTNNPPAGAFRGFGVTQTCFCTETLLNQMADLVGISPWEIRYRNAIRPGGVLPNGQIVDESTGLVETLEAIKPAYDAAVAAGDPVGIACAMKNAGVGVGIPDWGRCKLIVENDGKIHIYTGASCIGQGLGTVLVQTVVTCTGVKREDVVYERSNTWIAPDSGDTSGSRQTLVTGEATRRACEKLKAELDSGKTLQQLAGQEFYGEYLAKTDPLGADVPNPVSHVAYGYATQMCILDRETGKIQEDGGRPRRGQGREPPQRGGTDRGRRGDVHGLCPDGAVSHRRELQTHRQVRYVGAVPRQPAAGAGDRGHRGGEAGPECGRRRHRHRRDHVLSPRRRPSPTPTTGGTGNGGSSCRWRTRPTPERSKKQAAAPLRPVGR